MQTPWKLIAGAMSLVVLGVITLGMISPTGVDAGDTDARRSNPDVIILGFDGMDYELTKRMIAEGRLPSFERLAREGGFTPLGTSIPPQSPVAWSDFISGTDSGGHGIFDFIHRDPETMVPYLSTSSAKVGTMWKLGKYQIPSFFDPGSVELLRRGNAFWSVLEEHGIPTTIIRMPANFPPSGTAGRELSGMGTPDILGTYGTFSLYSSDPFSPGTETVNGGDVFLVETKNGRIDTKLYGPDNPFLVEPTRVSADMVVYVDTEADAAKFVIGDEAFILEAGDWSEWVPIAFDLVPTQALPAIARFYLRSVEPYFELYVSPLNIDPTAPAMPISTPNSYAKHLCKCTGYFYTQGMPEDTGAAKAGILDVDEFLAQAKIAGDENIAQYEFILDEFDGGMLFHYFGNTDLVGHIIWRAMDPDHPAYVSEEDAPYAEVMPELYEKMDRVVGHTLENMPQDTLLVVMSDHGFSPWRRAFHLNTWLEENGYLVRKKPGQAGDYYSNVDWSRTRAYGLGINGLYLNLKGREKGGTVDPSDRDALIAEIAGKLRAVVDPTTGQRAISKVYISSETYTDGGWLHIGPDIQVGYARGTRGSDESAKGEILAEVFTDNTDRWSGDHCMDHESVPGILLSSRPLKKEATELKNLAAAILAEYGLDYP
jgi:predicted AlkP superfamily phosphohydrolase/phosphomutase